MAGAEIESDLDLAFELQLQEAMTVSLSLEPSRTSLSPPDDDDDDDDDDILSLLQLQAEEMERYKRELRDEEQSQAEMQKMMDDLIRRIHDQRLVAEILRVPEDQWNDYGDYFQRPYDEASSSSSSSSSSSVVDTETFRVYFKGLVSEETVGDSKVTLAAIGAAICDSRDHLIFELGKPLKDKEMSREAAEIEALIEGLTAALTLNLKRVVFLCDDPIYLYFIDGDAERGFNVSTTLLNKVVNLQTKFMFCSPFVVPRNDIKFAIKLARDAILSQITKPVETGTRPVVETSTGRGKILTETCLICLEDTDVGRMFSVDGCLHRFCFSCMKQHVEVKLLHGILAPKCPHEGCKSELSIDSCRKVLPRNLINIMSERIKETAMPGTERVYCPYPVCSVLMSKTKALEYSKSLFHSAEQSGARKCVKCHGLFCINCKVPWHGNMTCDDYKKSYTEDARLNSLASSNRWRQCVKCSHMIELAEGCYHITCRCGYEFCYTCGAEWKNKKATCTCPIWDECNIIRD